MNGVKLNILDKGYTCRWERELEYLVATPLKSYSSDNHFFVSRCISEYSSSKVIDKIVHV